MGVRVSFVAIAYNEQENIGRALDAILALRAAPAVSIIATSDGL